MDRQTSWQVRRLMDAQASGQTREFERRIPAVDVIGGGRLLPSIVASTLPAVDSPEYTVTKSCTDTSGMACVHTWHTLARLRSSWGMVYYLPEVVLYV